LLEGAGLKDEAAEARAAAARIAPHLSSIKIVVPAAPAGDPPGIMIFLDGVGLAASQWNVATRVDPGKHVVAAQADGYKEYEQTVKVGADADELVVTIPALEKHAGPKPIDDVSDDASLIDNTGVERPSSKPAEAEPEIDPIGVAGFITTSAGLLGLTMGTVFGIQALSDVGTATDDPRLCPDKKCTPAGRLLIDEASTKATISTIGLAAGGVALAAGVSMLIYVAVVDEDEAPAEPAPNATAPKAAFVPGPGDIGLGVGLSF
jgi:hypothetical protein